MAPVSKKKQKKMQKQRKRQGKLQESGHDKKLADNEAAGDEEAEETCGLCFDKLDNPAILACKHKLCWDCLEKWKSKYDEKSKNTCPFCREKIPPTRQMFMKLQFQKQYLSKMKARLNHPTPIPIPGTIEFENDMLLKSLLHGSGCSLTNISSTADPEIQQVLIRKQLQEILQTFEKDSQELEEEMNGWTEEEILDDKFVSNGVQYEEMPPELAFAAYNDDHQKVLKWLGKGRPIPKERIDAKCARYLDCTFLHQATLGNRINLMKVLLQLGANVNPMDVVGYTPLEAACVELDHHNAALVLLEWGAKKDKTVFTAHQDGKPLDVLAGTNGNHVLAAMLRTPLGGRRCELFGLQGRSDLNGLTGVASTYNEKTGRYVVKIGKTGEVVQVRTTNLKRRDRTPKDYK